MQIMWYKCLLKEETFGVDFALISWVYFALISGMFPATRKYQDGRDEDFNGKLHVNCHCTQAAWA